LMTVHSASVNSMGDFGLALFIDGALSLQV